MLYNIHEVLPFYSMVLNRSKNVRPKGWPSHIYTPSNLALFDKGLNPPCSRGTMSYECIFIEDPFYPQNNLV